MTKRSIGVLTLIIFSCIATRSFAGIITATSLDTETTGAGYYQELALVTTNPNNDNDLNQNNLVVELTVQTIVPGPLDVLYSVEDSGGVSEYRIIESIDNDSGTDWPAMTLKIIGVAPGLDFDTPDMDPSPRSSTFPNLAAHTATLLKFDGAVQTSSAGSYEYHIDIPDGIDSFIIRHMVPEPGTLLLAGLAMLGILAPRRFRR